jgi:phosphatidylserine decarboxylase precursor
MNSIRILYDDGSEKYEKLKKTYAKGIHLQQYTPYFFLKFVTNQCATKFRNEKNSKEMITNFIDENDIKLGKHIRLCKSINFPEKPLCFKKDCTKREYDDYLNEVYYNSPLYINSQNQCISKFKSQNDFFIRKITNKPTNKILLNQENYIISGSESRVSIFKNNPESFKVFIKGENFSIPLLLDTTNKDIIDYYKDCYIIIFRLSPQDYHRFHIPFKGNLLHSKNYKGNYMSVSPILVKTKKNVYTKNKRNISYFETKNFGIVAHIAIGATCVGSIQLKNKKQFNIGDEYGNYQYGGSTNIVLINKKYINMSKNSIFKKIYTNSNNKNAETFCDVFDILVENPNKEINDDNSNENLKSILKKS